MHDFRRLHVWQKSRELFGAVDKLTRTFPRSDRGVVAGQLRRSAFSIPTNIAEGCGKSSPKETVRFLQIAAGSVNETESHIVMATDLGFIRPKLSEELLVQVVSIRKMLFRLSKHFSQRAQNTGT
ncbi:MAG: four helix bundle protein [Gemmatimonadetes bacterium]|nr:four helix bundle protein [Gemmatimonadota bacterium]